jgi:retron-type reverse transcriptase
MQRKFTHKYSNIISLENLFAAWGEFRVGKSSRKDVQAYELYLIDNIVQLHNDLANKTYIHGSYTEFGISDPKPRRIHKAIVRDRILHHAIYRLMYSDFDKTFIADSFSCRINKGSHKAMDRFKHFADKVSKNYTRTCWVLKCDIRKFFASIDHVTLLQLLEQRIEDKELFWLLKNIIDSFSIYYPNKGLPLGNLTSQLFCNVYMNEFDQFIKHRLRIKYYLRYADDFVFLSENKKELETLILKISEFLGGKLKLSLHPDKVFIKSFASGVDFLGWVHFPKYKVLRTATKRRMLKRVAASPLPTTLQSYLGLLSHGQSYATEQEVLNIYGFNTPTKLNSEITQNLL